MNIRKGDRITFKYTVFELGHDYDVYVATEDSPEGCSSVVYRFLHPLMKPLPDWHMRPGAICHRSCIDKVFYGYMEDLLKEKNDPNSL